MLEDTSLPLQPNYSLRIKTLVLMIAFITPFAANMFLPSLPSLEKHLISNNESLELTITFFLLGFGISQLFYGPLSDRFGRRKILFIGFLIALIGSIGCALANSVTELIFARFILGCGVGAGSALTRSILRDSFNGDELTKTAAQNGAILSIAPILAPMLGGYVYKWFGWQANFIFIAALIGIVWMIIGWLLFETNHYPDNTAIQPKYLIKNYWQVLTHPDFFRNALCAGLALSGVSVYLTITPFLYQEVLGVSPVVFGWLTALTISGLIIGRFLNVILLSYLSANQMMKSGIMCMTFAGIIMLVPGLFGIINISIITVPIIIFITGTGFIVPRAYANSLEPFLKSAGTAGALYGSFTLLISFIFSSIAAIIPSHNQNLLATIFIFLAIGVWISSRKITARFVDDSLTSPAS